MTKIIITDQDKDKETLQGSNAIDVLKFVMATMIVAMHTSLCKELANPWFRIAVPIFFILSSYFFFKKLNEMTSEEKENRLRYYVKRIFLLYVFWLIVLSPFVLTIKWDTLTSHGPLVMIFYIIRSILTGNFFGASWFLVALLIGVPMIFYLSKWLSTNWLLFATLIINICIVLQCGYGKGCTPIELFRTLMSKTLGTGLEFTFLVSLFWIAVGKWFAETFIRIRNIFLYIGCVISMICLYLENKFVDNYDCAFRHDLYVSLIPLCMFLILIMGGGKSRGESRKDSKKFINVNLLSSLHDKRLYSLSFR